MVAMQLPKVYQPKQYEENIYALWEKSRAFTPKQRGSKGKFSMVFPLPNANGDLHLGHALTNALHDILCRYHRMQGKSTLYLPGSDHAGFETWVVYEKKLRSEGKSRFDFSREELYQGVWDFVQHNKGNMENQFRALGASCDWSRFTFTLDEKVVRSSYDLFKRMWDDKLIYRGERLVNFCTVHGTSFSDIEVIHKQVKSKLYYINYPLTEWEGHITVATTRPETMLGDVAVAVNPDDDRYKNLIGKTLKLPIAGREIPIIADAMVASDFGSGAVKITPAHDPNDYELAEKHALPKITVIDHEGKITHEAPPNYRGLEVEEAREQIVANLKRAGMLEKIENYTNNVGHCYKCETPIQPLLKDQWFVDMKPLANAAIRSLRDGQIKFFPETKLKQAIIYLENIKDWNISRQIAWGIPIPAFQNVNDTEDWIYDERVDQEIIEIGGKTYHRDPDVFDTWFSSGQWPFVTLNYPKGKDFKQFYPLDVMETGFDILYQWVCRMIMMGLYVTGKAPFDNVYLHGMILDSKGQKMSKSKGNVISPMGVIEQFGSDALRVGLITGQTAGHNQLYNQANIKSGRNFCNKLWNVSRFIEDKLTKQAEKPNSLKPNKSADYWILTRLNQAAEDIGKSVDQYRFSEAYETLYHFLWDDFADWYLEASKVSQNLSVLKFCLDQILRLAHPFMPFITETIWQSLYQQDDSLLATSSWPKTQKTDSQKGREFDDIKSIVQEIRFIKNGLGLETISLTGNQNDRFFTNNADLIQALSGIDHVKSIGPPTTGVKLIQTNHSCWIELSKKEIDQFKRQLRQEAEKINKVIRTLEGRFKQTNYVNNAPKHLVVESHRQLDEARQKLAKLREQITNY